MLRKKKGWNQDLQYHPASKYIILENHETLSLLFTFCKVGLPPKDNVKMNKITDLLRATEEEYIMPTRYYFWNILDVTLFSAINQTLHSVNLLSSLLLSWYVWSLKNYFYVLFLKIVMYSFSLLIFNGTIQNYFICNV